MLERTSVELVRSVFPLEKRVRLLGVSLSNMGSAATDAARARDAALDPGALAR